jgi:hypothetical protein
LERNKPEDKNLETETVQLEKEIHLFRQEIIMDKIIRPLTEEQEIALTNNYFTPSKSTLCVLLDNNLVCTYLNDR